MRSGVRVALLTVGLAASAVAADRPLHGDVLRLKDPTHPAGRRFHFRAARDPGLGADVRDPRVSGATLEVTGAAPRNGATGVMDLPAARWTGLGHPAGSKGFRYQDRSGAVQRVVIRAGMRKGRIVVRGRGSAWPYVIAGPQGPIDVRLTIADQVFCAEFTRYEKNAVGRVLGRNAAAPPDCLPASKACGDGTLEGVEECDDGNTTSGDGCSAICRLENRSALCAGVPTASGATLKAVRVAQGFQRPTHAAAAPLDPRRLFVVDQPGRIRIIADGVLRAQPFLAIEDRVACCNERGLLSLAFHPQYASNGRFFVYYTDQNGDVVIARYRVSADPDVADRASERILLTIPHRTYGNHNGGQVAFGSDGYLYAGTGDGGGGGDPLENAQDGGALLGKLLRLNVDVDTPPYYAIPPTNPFVGPGDPRDEIWAIGMRNPWRFSFDRGTSDLYIGDVGQDSWEEVDVQPATSAGGENYGWDVFEGDHCYEPAPAPMCPNPPTGFTMPVVEYDHGQGCSITGGFVYRGCRMPDLRGTYFYSDYCTPFFRTFRGVTGGVVQQQADRTSEILPNGVTHVVSFGEDARGELYFVTQEGDTGAVYRIVPASE